jgi:hypothetical protein
LEQLHHKSCSVSTGIVILTDKILKHFHSGKKVALARISVISSTAYFWLSKYFVELFKLSQVSGNVEQRILDSYSGAKGSQCPF